MTVATALADANEPSPELVEAAVREALARSGQARANGVLLFLTVDFRKTAAACVRAASRAASCLQVSGGIVAGIADERRWIFDRPAVGVMVLGGPFGLAAPGCEDAGETGLELTLAGNPSFPPEWSAYGPHESAVAIGSQYSDPMFEGPLPTWQNGRITHDAPARTRLTGVRARIACSAGIRLLGTPKTVEASSGLDLQQVAGYSAVDSLRRELPAELHGRTGALPLHQLNVALIDQDPQANLPPRLLPLMSANADGSLTTGDRLPPGQRIQWAIRQPVHGEADMRATTARLLAGGSPPAFALYASCIGRGPYFYGGEDRDWLVLREQLPSVPLLGIYGSGQMMPVGGQPRLMQNSCVLALACARQET